MIGIGPFSLQTVVFAFAAFVTWLVARLLARRLPGSASKTAGGLIIDALFVGLVAARITFVLVWWNDYAARPLSMLAFGDGGFHGLAGVLAASAWLWLKTRQRRPLRLSLYGGMAGGLLVWGAVQLLPLLLQHAAMTLPAVQLSTLDNEQPVDLVDFTGQPVVLNLWATWCPPCRREMPVLMQAQTEYPDIAFVLVNQGENATQIHSFLNAEGLSFKHLLMDPFSSTMRETGSRGLPTTLFFDENGRMVASHVGELTTPALKNTLHRYFPRSPQSASRQTNATTEQE